MAKYIKSLVLVSIIFSVLGSAEIKADTGSTGYIGSSSTASSQSAAPVSSNSTASPSSSNSVKISNSTTEALNKKKAGTYLGEAIPEGTTNSASTSTNTASSSTTSAKSTTAKSAAPAVSASTVTTADTTSPASSAGVSTNVQSASVQVEPSSGSASLSIPIAVPPGRAGIQPNLALVYNSSERLLGNAGYGWTLDLGSIQISTKKGVPKYDGTDIFTMEQNGSTQDLVEDPYTPSLYHMEVEGAFANIQYYTDHWVITDKKGIKYYYGNTNDSKQNDPANPTHILRWALNRVEDLNGNYMTISYLNDNGQIYPQTISYTGNDQASLILSTYAQVSISYVAASSPSISYISKFSVKTAQRLDHITVSVGPNVQSTYTFTYHQSANSQRDLLQSVQQTGSDGITQLPAVTFTYNEALPQWQLASGWTIPSDFTLNMNVSGTTEDAGIKIADLNGDGYADFLRVSYNGSFISYSYLNNKNNGWTLNNNWALPSTTKPPAWTNKDWGIRLADFNGDGLMDISQSLYWGTSSGIQQFYLNNSSGFDTNQNFTMPSGVYFYTDPASTIIFRCAVPEISVPDNPVRGPTGVVIGDITGSGFPDFVQSIGSTQGVYINQYPQGSGSFSQNSSFTFPSSTTYTDFTQGATLVNLKGDGLSDIFYLKGGVAKAFLNTGSGWVETGDYENTFGLGDLTNLSTQMVDVNGDGLPDLVITTNGDRHNVTILLNTGSGWTKYQENIGDFNFFDYGTQFLDVNADGMQGYLTYETGGSPELYLNANKPVDLLTGVNNGIGATTTIQYDSDFHYQNTYMPYYMPVVKSTTTTAGSQSYTTTYNYWGGLWDKTYREFDGFNIVTVTDPYGNFVNTSYLQDHWLKGHASEQETFDAQGNLYSKSVNTWQTQTIATNTTSNQTSKFIYLARTDNFLYDGNSAATPKRTAQEFTYGENPQYGDVTQTINDGQVDPTAGTSIDANKTTTQVSYVYNTNNWIIGLPAQTTTQNTSGNTISKTSFYYDGDTAGTATPSFGRLTAKVNWLGSTTQADPKTTYTYDAYGNLQTTTDPNNNTTTITYDNTVHLFPVQTKNALNQNVTMTYYGIDAVPLNNGNGLQGLWGQERSKTDANNQTAYTTYDIFGRPSTSISPLDSVALPTEQKSYNIQSNYIAVTDTARVTNGSTATISTVSYYDGLGRLIETKSLGPTSGQYIVSGQTVYDDRGLPVTKYLPHFTTNNLNTMDSIDTTVPSSQAIYDPMGRVKTKTNPDGTYSSVTYNQWTTTTTDENGHMQQSFVDAFGRLIQKEEYTGADGRSPNYSAATYTLYATTSYSYDPKGNLTSVMDAHNNVTSITYDNLGRKIGMNDPDMGKWQYGYDGNGNLIWQQDAKSQVISFKYDALNRLINKTDAISGPIVNLPNLTSQAATFNVNYNFDDLTQSFGIGRLGSVAYDTGTAGFIYDQIGREVSSNKTIDGTTYNVTRQYDALNRLQQLQYPDGSQVTYVYNQAGQVSGVADAAAVINGAITNIALGDQTNNDRLAWFDKALGVGNAYAASKTSKTSKTSTAAIPLPTVSITAPASGASFSSGSNVKISTSAASSQGKVTKVEFYNGSALLGKSTAKPFGFTWTKAPVGNHTLSAKVYDSNNNTGVSAPVSIIVSGLPAVSLTAVADKTSGSSTANINLMAIATEINGTITKVAFYKGATLLGTASSPTGGGSSTIYVFTWKNVVKGSYSLKAKVYDANNKTAASKVVAITVSASETVSLTTTVNNPTVSSSASVNLSTTVSGKMTKVAFYNGTILLGTETAPTSKGGNTYAFTWSNVSPGNYDLTAKAYDKSNDVISSPAVSVTVIQPAPTVSLAANSGTYTAPATITLTATASEVGGTINVVEFYNGSTLLGVSGNSGTYLLPYTYSWNNVPAGNYILTAKAYDNNGNETTSSAISISVVAPNVYIKAIDYNANGQITQIQYGNGAVTAYTYDPLSFRLKRIYTSNAQAQVIQDLNYTYDSVGQVLSIKDNVNTGTASMNQTYAYDALNRLVSASGSYGSKTYAYDTIGNITLKDGLTYNYGELNSRVNGNAVSIGQAGPHAVTSLSDGSVFKYDADGNMVSLQKGSKLTQYVYDSQNRLQSVTVGGLTAATYAYDGDGGRIKKTVYRRDLALYNDNTNALLFGSVTNPLPATAQNPTVDTTRYVGNVYEIENPSSVNAGQTRQTKFIYLGSTRVAAVGSDGKVFYYHTDHLGGTNVLTDNTGAVRELTEYDPFGQVITHEKYGTNFATIWYYFTGKPLDDETGLIFLGARYYNPSLGRFITPDTKVQASDNPQTLNRYTYCNNNPVNLVDPTGHSWWKKFWHSVEKVFEDVALAIVAIAAVVFQPELVPLIGSFMAGVVTGAIVGGAIGGISSSIMGGDMGQGILTGAIGGAIFGGIGGFGLSGPAEVAAHFAGGAASGAINAEIVGGNAGINALINGISAGATEWAGESQGLFKFTGSYMTDVVKQGALGGIVGGATSAAFGGSFGRGFENGAETSAIAYTANDFVHSAGNMFDSQKYNSNNLVLSVNGNDSAATSGYAQNREAVLGVALFALDTLLHTDDVVTGEYGTGDAWYSALSAAKDAHEYANGEGDWAGWGTSKNAQQNASN